MCEYDTIYAETKPAAGEDRVLVDSCVYRILKVGNVRHRVKVTDCRVAIIVEHHVAVVDFIVTVTQRVKMAQTSFHTTQEAFSVDRLAFSYMVMQSYGVPIPAKTSDLAINDLTSPVLGNVWMGVLGQELSNLSLM
ncbi:hypothetical protein HG531_000807 [Fusarium graminearum]|nr:hypothetical protein HG531_000807 [Fusarium graminearum]